MILSVSGVERVLRQAEFRCNLPRNHLCRNSYIRTVPATTLLHRLTIFRQALCLPKADMDISDLHIRSHASSTVEKEKQQAVDDLISGNADSIRNFSPDLTACCRDIFRSHETQSECHQYIDGQKYSVSNKRIHDNWVLTGRFPYRYRPVIGIFVIYRSATRTSDKNFNRRCNSSDSPYLASIRSTAA